MKRIIFFIIRVILNILLVLFPVILEAQNILYAMPAEDTPHEATWLQWPHNFTYPPWWQEDNEPASEQSDAIDYVDSNDDVQQSQPLRQCWL